MHEYGLLAPVLGDEVPFSKTERVKETLASTYGYHIIARKQVWPPQARHRLNAGIASTPSRNFCTTDQDKSGYHVIVFIPGFNVCCCYS